MYTASACRGIARLGGRAFPLQMCEKGLIRRCSALVRFDARVGASWRRGGPGSSGGFGQKARWRREEVDLRSGEATR